MKFVFTPCFCLVFAALTLPTIGGCLLDRSGLSREIGGGGGASSTATGTSSSTTGAGGEGGAPPVPTCGDGALNAGEACDDGNTTKGDGCDPACAIEAGFTCAGEPSACEAVCGDGLTVGAEGCDDSGTASGDGCAAECTTESGYVCTGEPSACVTVCGDAMTLGFEVCDDGNTVSGDGCTATCTAEPGFSCASRPGAQAFCVPTCGDGLVVTGEDCEDGNTSPGDGCSDLCTFEATCGNGVVEPGEPCDFGDPGSATGCDASCALVPGTTCGSSVDLNDPAKVTVNGGVTIYSGDTTSSMLVNFGSPSCGTNGAVTPAVDIPTVVHRYRIGNKPASLLVETIDVGGNLDDTIVWAYQSCFDTTNELGCDDDQGPGLYSAMNLGILPAGTTVFLVLSGYHPPDKGPYQLKITEAP